MKFGGLCSLSKAVRGAMDTCFNYELLSKYSFKGKSKLPFYSLKLYNVIYGEYSVIYLNIYLTLTNIINFVLEALSGFRNVPQDENQFINIVDNYIRHSKENNNKMANK